MINEHEGHCFAVIILLEHAYLIPDVIDFSTTGWKKNFADHFIAVCEKTVQIKNWLDKLGCNCSMQLKNKEQCSIILVWLKSCSNETSMEKAI